MRYFCAPIIPNPAPGARKRDHNTRFMHKSGFVNIIGNPNVGKSTLMNYLVGERMSIITNKPQTTRHRILGILSEEAYQIVFSDTPGLINAPAYKMQQLMNSYVYSALEDADVLLFVTTPEEQYSPDDPLLAKIRNATAPLLVLLNKKDLLQEGQLQTLEAFWKTHLNPLQFIPISALNKDGVDGMLQQIISLLPEGPAYYPKDQLTDRPERFFVSEIIREKILELYRQEIPYSTEVIVDSFKEGNTNAGAEIVRIMATIFVERETQKVILLGKEGKSIKRLGIEARKALEKWLEKKVHLEMTLKVRDNWRDDDRHLRQLGYIQE